MSILPKDLLSTVASSMKTKKTRKKLVPMEEEQFHVREVNLHDDLEEDTIPVASEEDYTQAELACDVYNLEKKVLIIAPIAGAKMDDIKVKVAEDVITIAGERKNPLDVEDEQIHTQECFWGEFSRSIILPPNVDTSKIKAGFKNALLTIEVPKIQTPKEKVIKIIAG